MVHVTCLHCKKEFNVIPANIRKGKGKYCSRQCLSEAKEFFKRIDATCKNCGKSFQYRPSEGERVYCSIRCYHTSTPKIKKKCITCGADFEVHPCTAAKNKSVYCSQKCFGLARRGKPAWNTGKRGEYSEETYRKMSDAHKGKPSPFKGVTGRYTEETRRKISDAGRRRKGQPGKKHSDETKKKLSVYFTGRKRPELAGENHHLWKGGIAYLPYCNKFNKRFKDRVREYFGNRCVRCGKTKDENRAALSVHHVDENKNTCCDGSKPVFVALCSSCHGTVHTHKDTNWQEFFTDIIERVHDGRCYYTVEEYRDILINRI